MTVCKHLLLSTFACLQRLITGSRQKEWSVPRKLESRLSKASDDSGIKREGSKVSQFYPFVNNLSHLHAHVLVHSTSGKV